MGPCTRAMSKLKYALVKKERGGAPKDGAPMQYSEVGANRICKKGKISKPIRKKTISKSACSLSPFISKEETAFYLRRSRQIRERKALFFLLLLLLLLGGGPFFSFPCTVFGV